MLCKQKIGFRFDCLNVLLRTSLNLVCEESHRILVPAGTMVQRSCVSRFNHRHFPLSSLFMFCFVPSSFPFPSVIRHSSWSIKHPGLVYSYCRPDLLPSLSYRRPVRCPSTDRVEVVRDSSFSQSQWSSSFISSSADCSLLDAQGLITDRPWCFQQHYSPTALA